MRDLADLPNQWGFKFIGIRHNGTRIKCEVVFDKLTYRVINQENGMFCFSELCGWIPDIPLGSRDNKI